MTTLSDRLARRTDRNGEHHCWLGTTGADGTPQIRVDGHLTTVRRVMWEQAHGPLSAGTTVAACPDEPRCVRVDHLSLGRKRRSPIGVPLATRSRSRRGSGSMRQVRPGIWELALSASG